MLERTEPGRGGEIQLTDALQELAAGEGEGYGVYGVVFRGRRYDTGDKLSYLKACVQLACDSEDLGPGLREWLPELRRQPRSQPDQVTPVGGSFNWPVTLGERRPRAAPHPVPGPQGVDRGSAPATASGWPPGKRPTPLPAAAFPTTARWCAPSRPRLPRRRLCLF